MSGGKWCALALSLLLALSPVALAESPEVSALQAEAPAEEADALFLGSHGLEPGDGYLSKGSYVPRRYEVDVSGSLSRTLYVGDSLDLRFTGGAVKSLASKSPKIADVAFSDPAAGTCRVVALKAGNAKVKVKLESGKKLSVALTVKDPDQPDSVSLPEAIAMNVGEALALEPELTPLTAETTFQWSTEKKKVATVSEDGVVTALREGTAKITVKTANGKKATVKVTVLDSNKPDSVEIVGGNITLNVGDIVDLEAELHPASAVTQLTWSSGKKSVAAVSEDGALYALKEGTAKITVKTSNGKKATCTVTVVDDHKPEAIALVDEVLGVGDTIALEPLLSPSDARTWITWSSSDKKVATVSPTGEVTGVKTGSAKITAKTTNGKKAACTVTVQNESVAGVRYRALLVANDDFYWGFDWERGTLNASAARKLKDAISGLYGAEGGGFAVTFKTNLDKAHLTSAIQSTFARADDNDVSLFYFASHGDSLSKDSSAGALLMASVDEAYPEYMKLSELSALLAAVPGRVVVLLDTCGSGAGVYSKGASPDPDDWIADFDAAVVRAFSGIDQGVVVPTGDAIAKTGELRRVNKFYVLTSSKYLEDSWAYNNDEGGGSLFTDWLVDGIGKRGDMPADTLYQGNADATVDLWELYSYISGVGDDYPIYYNDKDLYQHVQVYPSKTRFGIFR